MEVVPATGLYQRWVTVSRKDFGKKALVWDPYDSDQTKVYSGIIQFQKYGHIPLLLCDDGISLLSFAWFYMVEFSD